MEKSEVIIDLVEHPERYTDSQMQEILSDDEAVQLYAAMLDARMAIDRDTAKHVDVDSAWREFAAQNAGLIEARRARRYNASGYAWRTAAAVFVGVLAISGIAFATIHVYNSSSRHVPVAAEAAADGPRPLAADTTAKTVADSAALARPAVCKTFENVEMADMLGQIAAYYGMVVEFRNDGARRLRYYYEWNSAAGIDAVVDELNHSKQVALTREGKKIVVE